MTGYHLARGSRLVIATHNANKLEEFSNLIAPFGITVVSSGDLGLPEPEETAKTFAGNATIKAQAAAFATNLPALADDSGLCVAALNGAPGIYSSRWTGPNKDFTAAMRHINYFTRDEDPTAWFICVLCLALPSGQTWCFEGRIDGEIVWPPRGDHGHGYDPIFQPKGATQTLAEMTSAQKNSISHRAQAFNAFRTSCLEPYP
ncbi:MAG: RdgB/HAM1 family non-canonical purine NTP pyrophosphatase [Acetobacter sp.]|nr:RdgB/HAM1 family non-canonical purine NTP pyrophosphatase [Acetobacter sp.]